MEKLYFQNLGSDFWGHLRFLQWGFHQRRDFFFDQKNIFQKMLTFFSKSMFERFYFIFCFQYFLLKVFLRESLRSKYPRNHLQRFVSTRHPSQVKSPFKMSQKLKVFDTLQRERTFKSIRYYRCFYPKMYDSQNQKSYSNLKIISPPEWVQIERFGKISGNPEHFRNFVK